MGHFTLEKDSYKEPPTFGIKNEDTFTAYEYCRDDGKTTYGEYHLLDCLFMSMAFSTTGDFTKDAWIKKGQFSNLDNAKEFQKIFIRLLRNGFTQIGPILDYDQMALECPVRKY